MPGGGPPPLPPSRVRSKPQRGVRRPVRRHRSALEPGRATAPARPRPHRALRAGSANPANHRPPAPARPVATHRPAVRRCGRSTPVSGSPRPHPAARPSARNCVGGGTRRSAAVKPGAPLRGVATAGESRRRSRFPGSRPGLRRPTSRTSPAPGDPSRKRALRARRDRPRGSHRKSDLRNPRQGPSASSHPACGRLSLRCR